MKPLKKFDKYEHYFKSVQETDEALDFLEKVYRENFGKKPKIVTEDFCGTFAMSCTWVKRAAGNLAIGVDASSEPIDYGQAYYASKLTADQKKRLSLYQKDVRDRSLPKTDLIAAFNFSYFIMKQRKDLLTYFKNCHSRLNKKGILVLDCFGGSGTLVPNVEDRKFRSFTYYWDQKSYDPITHEALFYIHFKRKGEKKRERVFRYDWRMWTIAELRDVLYEAGFSQVDVYWEGTNSRGGGDGIFSKKKHEKNCEAWIAYVVGRK